MMKKKVTTTYTESYITEEQLKAIAAILGVSNFKSFIIFNENSSNPCSREINIRLGSKEAYKVSASSTKIVEEP